VIYASGYSEEAALREALGHDHAPYLGKPFNAESLLACVRDVLDRGRMAEAATAPEVASEAASEPASEPASEAAAPAPDPAPEAAAH
jgi:DNA-binding NarL/FixJ family response regulator